MSFEQKEFYSLKEAAEIIGVAYVTIYGWARNRKIKAYKRDFKSWRIDHEDLMYFLKK